MFQTRLKYHRRLTREETRSITVPVTVWFFMAFVFLGMVSVRLPRAVNIIGTIGLLLSGIAIVPIFIVSIKRSKRIREITQIDRDVFINAIDNELYIDNMKVKATKFDDGEIMLEEADVPIGQGFAAPINKNDREEFLRFCEEYSVEVELFEE